MRKNGRNQITLFFLSLFMVSLFISSAGLPVCYAGGIGELNSNINTNEISDEASSSSSDCAGNTCGQSCSENVCGQSCSETNCEQSCNNCSDIMNITPESVASGIESIKNGFKSIFEGFKDIFKGIIDIFKELINSIKQLFSSAGEEIGGEIQQGVEGVSEAVQGAADAVNNGASDGSADGNNNSSQGTSNQSGTAANNNTATGENGNSGSTVTADGVSGAVQGAADAVNNGASNGSANGTNSSSQGTSNQSGTAANNTATGENGNSGSTVTAEDPDGLNVRTGPWGDVIGTLQKGSKIEILGREGDWYKIKFDGKEAYVYAGLVSIGDNKEPKNGANAGASASAESNAGTTSQSENSTAVGVKIDQTAPVNADTPYFCQYDNEFFSSSSCQNTSIAMTLAKYGWKGNPDQITKGYGKDMAQTPQGLEYVFNAIAEKNGLNVRVKSHTAGTMELVNKLLAEGKPVIAHGWFTKSGHVVTITGFDGENYTVNDPAGKWNGQFKGGYSDESGKGVKYSKEAMIEALVEDGEVWCHEIYEVGEKTAGL